MADPSVLSTIGSLIPAGTSVAQLLAQNNGLSNATNTINQGVAGASSGLNTAAQQAILAQQNALQTQQGIATNAQTNTAGAANTATIAQLQALLQQQGLYQTTLNANAPYQTTGLAGNSQLQSLIADPNSLQSTPGYQFELQQGLQGQQRQEAAQGTLGNGGTIKAATRYALDYANTKYNDAVNRLLQVTNVGQTANAANQRAGEVLGSQIGTGETNIGNIATGAASAENQAAETLGQQTGTEATNVGNIGTQNAENQASLTLAQAQLAATNQKLAANNVGSTIGTIGNTIGNLVKNGIPGLGGGAAAASPTIGATGSALTNAAGVPIDTLTVDGLPASTVGAAGSALGTEGAAAGAAGAEGAAAATEAGSAAVEGATAVAGATEGATAGTGAASAGALSAITGLMTNPITIGIGAAIGAALIWQATQVHPVANTFVQNYQNPFGKQLGNVVDSFDQALAGGQLTKAQAQTAYTQTANLIQGFENEGANFAKQGDKQSTVWKQAQQTMATDFGGTGSTPDWSKILGKMQTEIANLPG